MEGPLADGVEGSRIQGGEFGAGWFEDGVEASDEARNIARGGFFGIREAEGAFGGACDEAFIADHGFPERFWREGAGQDAALADNGDVLESRHAPLHASPTRSSTISGSPLSS